MRTLRLSVLVLLATGCGPGGVTAPTAVQMSGECMGTTWSAVVTLQPGDEYDDVVQIIQAELDAVDRALSTWKTDSDVSLLNRAAVDKHIPATRQTLDVLRLSDGVVDETGGAFDPTVGPLVRLWGFGAYDVEPDAPTEEDVAAARRRIGWDAIVLGPDWVARSRDDVEVDTSAVAKGYGVDVAAEALVASGHLEFLLEVGGEVVLRGSNPDGNVWRVGVDDPLPPQGADALSPLNLAPRAPVARLGVRDVAVATSGDYRNVRRVDGRIVNHTIDPRTGLPVKHALASATVITATCGRADALATAALVLGPDAGLALLEGLDGVEGYLLVRTGDPDAPIEARMTSGMPALLLDGSLGR